MMELVVFKAKASTPEELEMVRQALNGLFGNDEPTPEEIQKLKKSERNKKDYENRKLKNAENAESAKEEREEKEEALPLFPPLPFSPNTPYPITPYNPPLPEEKEEREEKVSRQRHGNFKRVLLSESDYSKLLEKFGEEETADRIQRLDDYLENNRKKHYDNHYLTILNWARKEEKEKAPVTMEKRIYSFAEVGEMERRGEL